MNLDNYAKDCLSDYKSFKQNKKLVIIGTGSIADCLIHFLKIDILRDVKCFVETNPKFDKYKGKPVISIKNLNENFNCYEDTLIIIASSYWKNIEANLSKKIKDTIDYYAEVVSMESVKINKKKLIAYGFGDAFNFFNEYYGDLTWKYIVDRDIRKCDMKKVFHIDKLAKNKIFPDEYIIVFPFSNKEILNFLFGIGISEQNIIIFKELLENNKNLELAYENYKNNLVKKRIDRKNKLGKTFRNIENMYIDTLKNKIFYNNICLNEVLSGDINNLLAYIFFPQKTDFLFYQPQHWKYCIYGNGPILVPFFATFRKDHVNRINELIDAIGEENITLITTDEFKTTMQLQKQISFRYDPYLDKELAFKKYLESIINIFPSLSDYEKNWLEYTVNYHMQLISFFQDVFEKIEYKILLSMFLYYLDENIINQISRIQNKITILHQHGNFHSDNRDSSNVHVFLYRYNFNADIYIVWNEFSKKVLLKDYNIKEEKIKVLGNIMQYKKIYRDQCHHKFLVILPGAIDNHYSIIKNILFLANDISQKSTLSFDIRFHPLNNLANERFMEQVNYDKNVHIENCDFNDYEFMIGTNSTLLEELIEGGHLVFKVQNDNFTQQDKFIKKINAQRELFYKNEKLFRRGSEDVKKIYKNYILSLLK